MEVKALTKFARMSDKKVREISREIQGLNAAEALEILKLVPRKSAKLVAKTLASAIASVPWLAAARTRFARELHISRSSFQTRTLNRGR